MKKSIASIVLCSVACAALMGGCKSASKTNADSAKAAPAPTKTAATTPAAPKQASMGVVNSKCPMMHSHPAGTTVTTEFQGKKVGFCCKDCLPGWNKLSDAEKAEKLKAAM